MLRIAGVSEYGASDCEAIGSGLLHQPTNAVTSLAYLAAGAWLARRLGRDVDPPAAGLAFSGLLAANGIGSFVYHGPQPPGGELIHDLPALGLLGMAVAVTADRIRRGSDVFVGRTGGRIAVAAVALGVGGVANVAGRTGGVACDPDSLWQLHGVWHVATAVGSAALGLLYFDRSGRPDPEPRDDRDPARP